MLEPRIGEVWEVAHVRKGTFTARVVAAHAEWVDLQVVQGTATMVSDDDAGPGEVLNVRRTFTTFVRRVS